MVTPLHEMSPSECSYLHTQHPQTNFSSYYTGITKSTSRGYSPCCVVNEIAVPFAV